MQADHHIHIILDGADWRAAIAAHRGGPNEAVIRQRLQAYQAAGVTYLRDGGDRWGVCLLAAQLAPEYGIRYAAPGAPIRQFTCSRLQCNTVQIEDPPPAVSAGGGWVRV